MIYNIIHPESTGCDPKCYHIIFILTVQLEGLEGGTSLPKPLTAFCCRRLLSRRKLVFMSIATRLQHFLVSPFFRWLGLPAALQVVWVASWFPSWTRQAFHCPPSTFGYPEFLVAVGRSGFFRRSPKGDGPMHRTFGLFMIFQC